MDKVFNFVWAALCAWIIVWLLGYWGASEWPVCSSAADLIHSWGWPAKKVVFIILFLILWASGLHKYIGRVLCILLGIAMVIIVAGLIVLLAYWFINWLAGCL